MPIICQAFILCGTDDPSTALNGINAILGSAAFELDNPVMDFAVGIQQVHSIAENYQDGEFLSACPEARLLISANDPTLPC